MADVVEQGEEPEGPDRFPAWVRRLAVVVAIGLGLFGLSRAGLLTADDLSSDPEPTETATAEPADPLPLLVARQGDRMLLAGDGEPEPGARLPADLPPDAQLVPMRLRPGTAPQALAGAGPVLGVAGGELVRVDPGRPRYRSLGPGDAVVSAAATFGRALVLRGGDLVEIEIATGGVTDAEPYPGFDADDWTAEGLLAATGSGALVMTQPAGAGLVTLALGWSTGLVRTGLEPEVELLGTVGPLLGVADDWVITLGPGCPGTACRIQVVSVTADQSQIRDVAPPEGWTFVRGPSAGRTHEALVPVEHLTRGKPDGRFALARLVPGGDNALLVAGTSRIVLDAGLADGPGGSVYLLVEPEPGEQTQARVWAPQSPSGALPLSPQPEFPGGSRLVCVCG